MPIFFALSTLYRTFAVVNIRNCHTGRCYYASVGSKFMRLWTIRDYVDDNLWSAFNHDKSIKNIGRVNMSEIMKRFVFILACLVSFECSCFAQDSLIDEESLPTYDTEIERKCSVIDIEGNYYFDVTVTLKSLSPDFFSDLYKVKVLVKDENKKTIYKNTLKNAYMYIYSNGQIQIGKPKFNQIIIASDPEKKTWIGLIREKEGVW